MAQPDNVHIPMKIKPELKITREEQYDIGDTYPDSLTFVGVPSLHAKRIITSQINRKEIK